MEKLNLSIEMTALIVFLAQIIFLYLRTINVKAVAKDKLWPAMFSGVGIGMAWLLATAAGVNSMMEGNLLPIFAHLAGGAIGTYLAMIKKHKKKDGK